MSHHHSQWRTPIKVLVHFVRDHLLTPVYCEYAGVFYWGLLVSDADNNKIEITVLNWERYNPRKDGKHYSWFRLNNNVFSDEKLFDLTLTDKALWVFILCLASVKNCPTFVLDCAYAASQMSTRASRVSNSVRALCKSGVISSTFTFRNTEVGALHNITTHNKTKHNTIAHSDECASVPKVLFDLEVIYTNYPRKLGKTRGLAKLKTAIKTQADYDDLTLAVANYSKAIQGTETRFVKHFSTWVTEWRDWVKPEAGSAPGKLDMMAYLIEHDRKKNEQRKLLKPNEKTGSELRAPDAAGTNDTSLG